MIANRAQLERAVQAAQELGARRKADPIRYIRWLPLQDGFLRDLAIIKQIRAGNQGQGKTTAALAEVAGRCIGRHPLGLATPPPPVHWWVVCSSWGQSVKIMGKLWDLLPPGALLLGRNATRYRPGTGFAPKKAPIVYFANGSTIEFKTARQEGLDLSGATLNGGVLFDEPPRSQRIYTEVLQRVEENGGIVLLSYTPVNAPTEWLRELCEAGAIADHWSPLTPESLIPVGYSRPLRTADGREKDADYIRQRELKVSDYERPVIIHGEWEFRAVDRYFTVFRDGGQDSHVHEVDDRIPDDVDFILGIDHGSRPGKQIAVLIATWLDDDGRRHIYVLDEYVDFAGTATPSKDAAGILDMLERQGLTWEQLSFAGSDRVHMPGSASEKGAKDLQAQIAKQLDLTAAQLHPPIRVVKRGTNRGAGSVETRSRWLYMRMVEPNGFGVHPRCVRVREALNKYDMRDNDWKDPVDAIVYGCDRLQFGAGIRVGRPREVHVG